MVNNVNTQMASFICRLAEDPKADLTPRGSATSQFKVNILEDRSDKENEEADKEYIGISAKVVLCRAFGRMAEILNKYVISGSKLDIKGKIRDQQYEEDGHEHYIQYVKVDEFILLEKGDLTTTSPQEFFSESNNFAYDPDNAVYAVADDGKPLYDPTYDEGFDEDEIRMYKESHDENGVCRYKESFEDSNIAI